MTQPGRPGEAGPAPSEQLWADSSWAARASFGAQREITAYCYLDVWLIEVASPLRVPGDVIDLAIQLSLAESPRGVVCSVGDASVLQPIDLELLGRTGRHVRNWPGAPLLLVCPDDRRWSSVQRQPEARLLQRSSSLLHAWSQIRALLPTRHVQTSLTPDARAAGSARRFLSSTCEDWDTPQHLSSGPIVVSELVTNAVEHTGGPVDLHLAEHGRELRVGVRDHGEEAPVTRADDPASTSGRGLRIVQSLCRATGALPAAGGGKLVWAVLAADPVTASG